MKLLFFFIEIFHFLIEIEASIYENGNEEVVKEECLWYIEFQQGLIRIGVDCAAHRSAESARTPDTFKDFYVRKRRSRLQIKRGAKSQLVLGA